MSLFPLFSRLLFPANIPPLQRKREKEKEAWKERKRAEFPKIAWDQEFHKNVSGYRNVSKRKVICLD